MEPKEIAGRVSAEDERSPLPIGAESENETDGRKRLVDLGKEFGAGWQERYRRRPLVDALFGTARHEDAV